jgi:hypothetical protein
MKTRGRFGTTAAALACLAMLAPQPILAQQPVPAATMVEAQDVALREGGLLVGQVLNREGLAQANVPVVVHMGEHEIVRSTTDQNGVFVAQGLRGGQYTIASEQGYRVCRLWAPGTAPPSAEVNAVIVQEEAVVRGQWGYYGGHHGAGHPWLHWMKKHPYVTAGVIAGAIAIPIAFADDDDGPSS